VQLTATAADGFEFVRWDGAGCATGTVLMDGARTCTAIFQATPPAGCDPEAEELCRSQGGRWDESACLCEMVSRGARVLSVHGWPTWTTPSGSRRVVVADDVAAGGGGEPASSAVVVASVRGPGVADRDLRSLGLAIARRLIDLAEWARPATGRGRVRATAVVSGRTVTARASAWLGTGPTAAPPASGPAAAFRAGPAAVSFVPVPGLAGGPHESDDLAVAAPALPPPPTTLQVVEYYHLDALGSVRAVTDAQGQVIARHDFLPFGEELAPQVPPRDRRLFTGQERDFETGLDYFHARQLRVDLGRFTAPDPLTELAWTDGTLGATNAYGYVQSNPLGFTDPMGAAGQEPPPPRADPCTLVTGNPCFRSGVIAYTSKVIGYDPAQAEASFQEFVFVNTYLPGQRQAQTEPSKGGGGQNTQGQPANKECPPLVDNLQGTDLAGLDTLADAFVRISHPLEAIGANMTIFAAAGGQLFAGGFLVAAGCLNPTPFEPATCGAAIFGAGHAFGGAIATGYAGYMMFRHVTLPAIKEWGCR
jgi:RHS repeat-associated protein